MCRSSLHHRHHHLHDQALRRPRQGVEPDHAVRRATPERDLDLRIDDRQREEAATALREHAAAGRLTVAELEERLEATLTARTGRELRAPLADLPPLPASPPHTEPARRQDVGAVVGPWLVVSIALVLLWAVSGGGAFWPVWPILGWGIAVWMKAGAVLRERPPRARAT
jgi:hypothetical protein